MDRLPPEIWARVCSLSDIRSLKRIRLANSGFTQIAARYLFEGLCVTLIPCYFDKVTEVAFHPNLRFNVRTLYFDYQILDKDAAEYNLWKIRVEDSFYGDQVAISQADLRRHHATFNQLLASQEACFDGRMDLAMLSAALAMLPNLRAIRSMDEVFDYRVTTILSGLQRCTLPRDSGLGRPLASLLCGLGLTRKQIVTMGIDSIPWSFWEDKGSSVFLNGAQQLFHSAFRNLESMTVSFSIDTDDLEVRLQGFLPSSITIFISAAQRLRSLDLSFTSYHGDHDRLYLEDKNWWERLPNVGQVFTALTLPNLVEFRLALCKIAGKNLEDFITRHASTLERIRICGVALDSESIEPTSWAKTLRLVAPIVYLDKVSLYSLFCDDIINVILAEEPDDIAHDRRHEAYCKALEDFLLQRGRTECPRIADYAKQ